MCLMNIMNILRTGMNMNISHVSVSWLCHTWNDRVRLNCIFVCIRICIAVVIEIIMAVAIQQNSSVQTNKF